MNKKDKRRFIRVNYQHVAQIIYKGKIYKNFNIENLSMKSCLLTIDKTDEFSIDDDIQINLILSDQDDIKIEITGKIVRIDDNKKIAVFFEKIDSDGFNNLKNIIERNIDTDDINIVTKELINYWRKTNS